jgi:importin subunit alpha-1
MGEGLLETLKNVLKYSNKSIKKEVFWLISNIAANSEEDATKLLDSQIVFNIIYALKDSNYDLKKEALWALCNICHYVNDT